VCGELLIDPVLFLVRHAAAARDLPSGTGLIKAARLWAVTEGLESIPLLVWIPLVEDHFDRHPCAPDAAGTGSGVGAGGKTPLPSIAVIVDGRSHSMPGRWGVLNLAAAIDAEAGDLVEVNGFQARVGNGLGLPACHLPHPKSVFLMGSLTNAEPSFALPFIDLSPDAKPKSEIAMIALVKRPCQPKARLNGSDLSPPVDFHDINEWPV
jgi:hypothetical protein